MQQVNDRDLARRGWVVQPEAPRDPIVSKPVRDIDGTRTVQVPKGIDPGFAYNVGAAKQGDQAGLAAAQSILRKYETWPPELGAAVAREALRGPAFERFFDRPMGAPFAVGSLSDQTRAAIAGAQRGVVLSAATLVKQKANHPDLGPADYALIPDILAAPDVVAADGRPRHAVLIKLIGETFWLVVKATADGGENFVVSFRRANLGNLRSLRRRAHDVPLGDLDALIRKLAAMIAARRRTEPDANADERK